ncbi:hypothetical protein DFH09DRAFT_1070545 [Mycena vulgaris]|nr:hypothetical protein DFH09DRAFT_1070545 [Mycena vulgaris]
MTNGPLRKIPSILALFHCLRALQPRPRMDGTKVNIDAFSLLYITLELLKKTFTRTMIFSDLKHKLLEIMLKTIHCPLENVRRLEEAGRVAKEWEGEDKACFESEKTELLHVTAGCADLSEVLVRFGGKIIKPSNAVKWIGLWLDKSLGGTKHIAARSTSTMRLLNASMAVMHNTWGMRPLLIRDLIRTTVLP